MIRLINCYVVFACLSKTVILLVSYAKTNKYAWDWLTKLYPNRSHSWAIQLKDKFVAISWGIKSVVEYLHGLKFIVIELDIIESPKSEDDMLIDYHWGLAPKYKEIVVGCACTHDSPISFKELHDQLTDHEEFLNKETLLLNTTMTITVDLVFNLPKILNKETITLKGTWNFGHIIMGHLLL